MSPAGPMQRLGPRPLALHVASAAAAWTSSRAALPLLSNGSLRWRPELAAAGTALRRDLADVAPEQVASAVDAELRARAASFQRGLERYRHHPYRRTLPEPPVLWQEGTTRLLDYGPRGAKPVLVVPSLINRAYILDLADDKSLMRFLAASGLRPLLVDWGQPGEAERNFTLTDYVAGRLARAADAAAATAGAPFAVLGYCMGGLLALALADRRPDLVGALAVLATPWDFHAGRTGHARLLGSLAAPLSRSFASRREIPVDVLQVLFAALDPLLAARKFIRFAGLPEGSVEERDFVALEDWLNDGVPLALPVARECLADWYGANAPARGRWRIGGRVVTPSRVGVPTLVVVPAQDRIVPPATAAVLAETLPAAERLTPPLGHIGMMVAREARATVWQPLARWLQREAVPAMQTCRGTPHSRRATIRT
jgi:polyhydroxyalkanoate synthase subunit PhaC